MLFSAAAVSPRNVWAVGDRQSTNGVFHTLIEHWDGTRWSVVPSPNPGATGDHLFGVAQAGPDNVWAVGQSDGLHRDGPLVEHWNGMHWKVVTVPTAGVTAGLLQAVAVQGGEVWAAGQSDDATHQARPLVEHFAHGVWTAQLLSQVGTGFSDISGVAVSQGTPWIVGSAFDSKSGNQLNVVAEHTSKGWQQVPAPNPGTGDKVLGGISAAGNTVWAVGYFKTDTGRSPMIELHLAH